MQGGKRLEQSLGKVHVLEKYFRGSSLLRVERGGVATGLRTVGRGTRTQKGPQKTKRSGTPGQGEGNGRDCTLGKEEGTG